MNEHGFSRKIKKLLTKNNVFSWKISDNFAGGVPDFFIEGDAQDAWVEVKYIKALPKRNTTLIDLMHPKKFLSRLQQNWLRRRWDLRKDSHVLVGFPEGAILFSDKTWETPHEAGYYRRYARPAKTIMEELPTQPAL